MQVFCQRLSARNRSPTPFSVSRLGKRFLDFGNKMHTFCDATNLYQPTSMGAVMAIARRGTLFLEEFSKLDHTSQRNLLSLPQEDCAPADTLNRPRLVSLTTRNLEEEVRAGGAFGCCFR